MNATQEVREQYKQAVRAYIDAKKHPDITPFFAGRVSGLGIALDCLGVNSDNRYEMRKACEEQVKDESAQEDVGPGDVSYDEESFVIEEELDAIERPASQARVGAEQ